MGAAEPAKRSRLRLWLVVAVLAQLVAAGVLAGVSAVGWFDDAAPTPDPERTSDFEIDLPAGWVENLRWGQRLVEQVDPALIEALVYFAGLPGGAGSYDPTLSILREPLPSGAGLAEVANTSALFLAGRADDVSGASVFAGIEGTRPVLVEIQSLTAPSALGTPRRAVVGWDTGRLAMILAVLESRSGLALAGLDVYLNVVGGLKIGEPAADLAVAAALISSVSGVPVPPETVVFGEIGLSGEVRAVSRVDARLKEAAKLGFSRAIIPAPSRAQGNNRGTNKKTPEGTMEITEISRLEDLLVLFAKPDGKRPGQRAGQHDGAVAAANARGRGHG